jgi:hypothetical protein
MTIRISGGSGNYASYASASLTGGAAFTICGWIKNITGVGYAGFMGFGASGSPILGTNSIWMNEDSGHANITGTLNASGFGVNVISLATGTWQFVALSGAASGECDEYVCQYGDSSFPSSTGTSGTAGTYLSVAANALTGTLSTILAGGYEITGTEIDFNGELGYVRFWTTQLTPSQLIQEKNSKTPVNTSNLYLSWPMANSTDTSDQSGNGRTWTKTGTITNGASDPFPAGPTPQQAASLFLSAPLAALGWIIDRRDRVPKEKGFWRQDKRTSLFLPSWIKKD